MADRIIGMRSTLYDILTKELGSKKDWTHIKSQIGQSSLPSLHSLAPLPSPSPLLETRTDIVHRRHVRIHRPHPGAGR